MDARNRPCLSPVRKTAWRGAMGLLEQLLGAAVQGFGRGGMGQQSAGMGGSPLMSIILQLLTQGGAAGAGGRGASPLEAILGQLTGGGFNAGPGGRGAMGGGAMGGGGGAGADPLSQLAGAILGGGGQGGGGLGDMLSQFRQAGLGPQADSWVGTGENMPLSPGQLENVFGRGNLEGLASRHGMDMDEMMAGLSRELPGTVDALTPKGRMPAQDDLAATIGQLL